MAAFELMAKMKNDGAKFFVYNESEKFELKTMEEAISYIDKGCVVWVEGGFIV
jgi:hypothetical protein